VIAAGALNSSGSAWNPWPFGGQRLAPPHPGACSGPLSPSACKRPLGILVIARNAGRGAQSGGAPL